MRLRSGALARARNIALTNNNSAAIALTIGGNNQNTTFSGIFTGAGSLTKIGTGDTYLANGNSTFTGGFNISSRYCSVYCGRFLWGPRQQMW